MKTLIATFLLCFIALQLQCLLSVVGERTYDHKLSDAVHDEDTDKDVGAHEASYDHDAFLGQDEAKKWDKLTPEEAKKQFGEIIDKMPKNEKGLVGQQELIKHLHSIEKVSNDKSLQERWDFLNPPKEGLTLEFIHQHSFGNKNLTDKQEKDTKHTIDQLRARDERRFKAADVNNDGILDKTEFADFVHPENNPKIHGIIADETLDELDKDKDGNINEDEYINDIWTRDPHEKEDDEPKWVTKSREDFKKTMDKNNDGVLDRNEILDWMLPKTEEHIKSEAEHLVKMADTDKNGALSKEEMLNNYKLFVGSKKHDDSHPDEEDDHVKGKHDEF